MIQIVWEFRVDPNKQREFEKHYGPEGTWVELFCKDSAFGGTRLLRNHEDEGRYLTIDCWQSLEAYEAFRVQYAREYQEIDQRMEHLTASETPVGVFEVL